MADVTAPVAIATLITPQRRHSAKARMDANIAYSFKN
jgi:hypothetical protein